MRVRVTVRFRVRVRARARARARVLPYRVVSAGAPKRSRCS